MIFRPLFGAMVFYTKEGFCWLCPREGQCSWSFFDVLAHASQTFCIFK